VVTGRSNQGQSQILSLETLGEAGGTGSDRRLPPVQKNEAPALRLPVVSPVTSARTMSGRSKPRISRSREGINPINAVHASALAEADKLVTEKEMLKEAFRTMDGGIGRVDKRAFINGLCKNGFREATAMNLFERADVDHDGTVDYDEFLETFECGRGGKLLSKSIHDKQKTLCDVFGEFDKDGNGNIDMQEFRDGLREHGFRNADVDLLASMIDTDHDGTINYKEFFGGLEHLGKYADGSQQRKLVKDKMTTSSTGDLRGESPSFKPRSLRESGSERDFRLQQRKQERKMRVKAARKLGIKTLPRKQTIDPKAINPKLTIMLKNAFDILDTDGSGTLERSEMFGLIELMDRRQIEITPNDVEALFIFFDENRSGSLEYDEICSKLEAIHKDKKNNDTVGSELKVEGKTKLHAAHRVTMFSPNPYAKSRSEVRSVYDTVKFNRTFNDESF